MKFARATLIPHREQPAVVIVSRALQSTATIQPVFAKANINTAVQEPAMQAAAALNAVEIIQPVLVLSTINGATEVVFLIPVGDTAILILCRIHLKSVPVVTIKTITAALLSIQPTEQTIQPKPVITAQAILTEAAAGLSETVTVPNIAAVPAEIP